MKPICLAGLAAIVLLGGCSDRECAPTSSPLTIFAAATMTDALVDLEREFTARDPSARLAMSFSGSHLLRYQIEQGAPADVFVSGHLHHMEELVRQGLVESPRVFAHGELVVIVPHDNPAGIAAFEDLPRARRLVLGEESSPAGRYTRVLMSSAAEVLGDRFVADVEAKVVSRESNVRLVRAKVELGDADAAIVYRSDASSSSGRLRVVSIPRELALRTDYHVGVVAGSTRKALAEAWIDFVRGEEGQRILEKHGFEAAR